MTLQQVRYDAMAAISAASTPEVEAAAVDEAILNVTAELLVRAEAECPGFDSFVTWLVARQERLTTTRARA